MREFSVKRPHSLILGIFSPLPFEIPHIDNPSVAPDTRPPVNENEEFCCVYASSLNGKRMLYGAEMDGVLSSEKIDLETANLNDYEFTELKLKLKASRPNQIHNYHRYKLRNWWCQSYLTGVRNIIVGTRTDKGILNTVEEVRMSKIPRLAEVI